VIPLKTEDLIWVESGSPKTGGRCLVKYLADPNQIILQHTAGIRDVAFSFEIREETVEKKEPNSVTSNTQRKPEEQVPRPIHNT
jgi:hypothetical protein